MARLGKIVAVANQKGGVGKTTTSINLAAALARKRKKILLVDSDPQGNATSGVGVNADSEQNNHLYHLYTGTASADESVVKTSIKNLSLIPSNINLVAAELELVSFDRREYKLKEILDPLREEYDFVIIDCPPSLGLLTLNALTSASSVLIPMQCEYFAMEGLARLISSIRSVKKSFNNSLYIEGLVLTMFDKRN
ncbi:MAG: ParA family protein, partial [Deltaproteobacteria bacterium]|nr:ParA family protein [Deltaproteobacteria bacterium]